MAQTVLITGASIGIGAEFARVFAQKGYNLVLVARGEEKLRRLADEVSKSYGVSATVMAKDLSKPDAAKEMYDELQEKNIVIDVLVNNAGFGDFGLFMESDWSKTLNMMNLNMITLAYCSKLFGADMLKRKSGKILNVASTASFQPGPLMAVYYATKAFVLFFSEAIANELKGTGVTMTALCPGATESGFQEAAAMEDSKLVKGKKMPTSREVAEYGFRALMNGKTVAVHGIANAVLAQSVRFLPRSATVSVVRWMSERA